MYLAFALVLAPVSLGQERGLRFRGETCVCENGGTFGHRGLGGSAREHRIGVGVMDTWELRCAVRRCAGGSSYVLVFMLPEHTYLRRLRGWGFGAQGGGNAVAALGPRVCCSFPVPGVSVGWEAWEIIALRDPARLFPFSSLFPFCSLGMGWGVD